MVKVVHKDPGDGSLKIIVGKVVEQSEKGIIVDTGKDEIIVYKKNILKVIQ